MDIGSQLHQAVEHGRWPVFVGPALGIISIVHVHGTEPSIRRSAGHAPPLRVHLVVDHHHIVGVKPVGFCLIAYLTADVLVERDRDIVRVWVVISIFRRSQQIPPQPLFPLKVFACGVHNLAQRVFFLVKHPVFDGGEGIGGIDIPVRFQSSPQISGAPVQHRLPPGNAVADQKGGKEKFHPAVHKIIGIPVRLRRPLHVIIQKSRVLLPHVVKRVHVLRRKERQASALVLSVPGINAAV